MEQEADFAVVVGGFNSSNTTHLVELLEPKFPTFFVRNEDDLDDELGFTSFDIHTENIETLSWPKLPNDRPIKVIITSGASCPDAVVDRVLHKIKAHFKRYRND